MSSRYEFGTYALTSDTACVPAALLLLLFVVMSYIVRSLLKIFRADRVAEGGTLILFTSCTYQ